MAISFLKWGGGGYFEECWVTKQFQVVIDFLVKIAFLNILLMNEWMNEWMNDAFI